MIKVDFIQVTDEGQKVVASASMESLDSDIVFDGDVKVCNFLKDYLGEGVSVLNTYGKYDRLSLDSGIDLLNSLYKVFTGSRFRATVAKIDDKDFDSNIYEE
mgnify:CR=1 FL=1